MKRARFAVLVVLLGLVFSSCSTLRMRYTADIENTDGKKGTVAYENSYNVGGGFELWCPLTAIFLGGACWYYALLPTVPHQNDVRNDANLAVAKKLGNKNFKLEETMNDSVSYEKSSPVLELTWDENSSTAAAK